MKLSVPGLVGLMLSAALSVGCGPGLSHRVIAPDPPTDVFNAMDAELAHAMTGTTTVTSAEPRPVVAEAEPQPVVAPTWGIADTSEVAAAVPAATAASAALSVDMHPYD